MTRAKYFAIFFAIFSAACGWWCYHYWLPKLYRINFIFNFLKKIYYSIHIYISEFWFSVSLVVLFALAIFGILWIIYFCALAGEKKPTSRGSACWATKKDIKELISNKGVPVGRFGNKILRIDDSNLVTCAGTRSGKGVGAIIPTLLEYPDSIMCLDIKGENYAITANQRKNISEVYAIDPFHKLPVKSNSYNWLDVIDINNQDCIEKAQKIATMLVGRSSSSSIESHFDDQAIRLLQGVILYICATASKENRNIISVSKLIHTLSINKLCESMSENNNIAFGVVSSIGKQFLNNANEREIGSILSTAQRATNFLDNPNIAKTLTSSDFDITKLPDIPITIYLIIPPDKVSDYQAYIRVFFDLVFSSIITREKKGKYNVLFLLDEVASLGYMKSLVTNVATIKGMGGQLWFFFQNLSQIKKIYGEDASTILGNSTQIFYGCNDLDTSKLVSDHLGNETIKEYDENSDKYHLIKRELLTSDEIRKLSPEYPIILKMGKPPIKVKRLCYYKDKEYKGLFDKNPYFNS